MDERSKQAGRDHLRDQLLGFFKISPLPMGASAEENETAKLLICEAVLDNPSAVTFSVKDKVVSPDGYDIPSFNAGQHEYIQEIIATLKELRVLANKSKVTEYKL